MALTTKLPREIDQFAALPQTDYVESRALTAGAAELVQIPSDASGVLAKFVLFSWTADFCAKMGTATVVAAMPADTTDGSGSMLNPTFRKIDPAHTHISVVSTAASQGTMEFFLTPPSSAA